MMNRRRRQLKSRRGPPSTFVILSLSIAGPCITAFQMKNPYPTARRLVHPHSRIATSRHVAQQNQTEEAVEPYVFFSDFDYDYYQPEEKPEESPSTLPEELLLKESSSSYSCAIDPLHYDLSSPYTSRIDSKSTFVEYSSDGLCIPAGPVGRLKEEIANLLNEPAVEIIIASVILLNSLLVALSTLDSLSEFMPMILFAEIMVSTIFVVDFAARWFSSSQDTGKFVLDPQFGIDVLVVLLPLIVTITPDSIRDDVIFLPSALSKPSELFNLRLLRVLRLQRFLRDLDTFERFMERVSGGMMGTKKVQEWQLKLARVVSSLFTLLSVVSGLIYTAENSVNPDISNYFDALYFSLTTLTTVGFGDVSPVTWQGKLIVCASIVLGVAIVPAQAASLVEALLDRERARNGTTVTKKAKNNFSVKRPKTALAATFDDGDTKQDAMLALDTSTTCPNCGASFHWSSAQYCYSCGEEL
ncbi:TrkA domain containing protein [Nitzschia inconspicua]|uniref:TrkA domain containing protein n=1 Tax=Nitzschia inconspicua TaxID=303405 RepID=A0A9K3KM94_9STRA|nr:TrkA domain containing protein [Nitzschia inconspicua]